MVNNDNNQQAIAQSTIYSHLLEGISIHHNSSSECNSASEDEQANLMSLQHCQAHEHSPLLHSSFDKLNKFRSMMKTEQNNDNSVLERGEDNNSVCKKAFNPFEALIGSVSSSTHNANDRMSLSANTQISTMSALDHVGLTMEGI